MKYLSTFLFTLLAITAWSSTTSLDTTTFKNIESLEISAEYAGIDIKTWDKNYVQLVTQVEISGGLENQYHNLTTETNNGKLSIKSTTDEGKLKLTTIRNLTTGETKIIERKKGEDYKDLSKYLSSYSESDGLSIGNNVDITLFLFVPQKSTVSSKTKYGKVRLEGSYASLNIDARYGEVVALLDDTRSIESSKLKSKYGEIDLSIADNDKATLDVATSYGKVMSDLPLEFSSDDKSKRSLDCISCTNGTYLLNNGASTVTLSAKYSNIYIRKKIKTL